MMPFERCVSKFSENYIIVEIGSTEFKLWQLKNNYYLEGGGLFQQPLTLVPLIEYQKFCDFRKA